MFQAVAILALQDFGGTAVKPGYYPVPIPLSDAKPACISREPSYTGTPRYGVLKIGDGPRAAHGIVVVDDADGVSRIYVDRDGDGDLTNDGQATWSKKRVQTTRTDYGTNHYRLRASWGGATETRTGEYGIGVYRIVTPSADRVFCYPEAARYARVTVGATTYKAYVAENDGDGLFNKALGEDGKPLPGNIATARPLTLILTSDDGKKRSFDARYPMEIDGKKYAAKISADGLNLALSPTDRKAPEVARTVEGKPLLAVGAMAPDFEADGPAGKVTLAGLRGKVVVLDFWATWCGPCLKSMPHLEQVWKKVQDKNVAVLALCVWDERDNYVKWGPANKDKYTFPLAFDPAGSDTPKSIASRLYNVNGIPTTYVIGADGRVVEAIVGYDDGDKRLEAALKKAGVTVD